MKDGGSAFPYSPTYKYPGSNGDSAWTDELTDGGTTGMTLRDYFAGQALVGFVGMIDLHKIAALNSDADVTKKFVAFAKASYEMADAMLEAREK